MNTIAQEFELLIEVAEGILATGQGNDLPIDQFLQLCLDIRNAERGEPLNLIGKNLVVFERDIIQ